jgi:hypothetical protein
MPVPLDHPGCHRCRLGLAVHGFTLVQSLAKPLQLSPDGGDNQIVRVIFSQLPDRRTLQDVVDRRQGAVGIGGH